MVDRVRTAVRSVTFRCYLSCLYVGQSVTLAELSFSTDFFTFSQRRTFIVISVRIYQKSGITMGILWHICSDFFFLLFDGISKGEK